jgi:hypothetical protein
MKKFIMFIAMLTVTTTLMSCGNRTVFDLVYNYDTAIISLPDGTVKTIEIKEWMDYEDGDQLQITDKDGTVYLVHSTNCVLIKDT